jgi:hypothetical protein
MNYGIHYSSLKIFANTISVLIQVPKSDKIVVVKKINYENFDQNNRRLTEIAGRKLHHK